jgi:hypothetical protein
MRSMSMMCGGAMRQTPLAALVVAGIGIALAGCGSAGPSTTGRGTGAGTASLVATGDTSGGSDDPKALGSPDGCGVYLSGGDARILTSAGEQTCRQLSAALSTGGTYWSLQPHDPSGPLGLICVMTRDGLTLRVGDSGTAMYGRNVCASLVSDGWQEDATAEQEAVGRAAVAARSSAEVAAEQASASARSAQEEQDERSAQQSIAQLNDDVTALADTTRDLSSNVEATDKDLATTRSDAAQGTGDYCSNMTTVSTDASATVASDVTASVASTVSSSVQPGLDRIRSDVEAVQRATGALAAQGLPVPAEAKQAIKAARAATSATIVKANKLIDRANADLTAAFRIANRLATEECSGPGEPPSGVPHVH